MVNAERVMGEEQDVGGDQLYSIDAATNIKNPAAPSAAVIRRGLESLALDIDLLVSWTASVVIFLSSLVGSMLGVEESWNIGATGVPSHMYR